MAAKTKTYSLHSLIALFMLSLPLLAGFLKYANRTSPDDITYNKPNLTGIVISDEKPKFSWSNWFNGTFQSESDDYNSDHWAFKEITVRLNNQFYYEAFNQIRVNNFVIGKDDYLYSENYIFSAMGDDLLPEEEISSLLEKAKVIQDTLKKKNIDLLLVYAPGKGSYCKEFIEDKYIHPVKNTNHKLFVKHSKNLGLNFLDLYSDFENKKATTPYPLFPKFGHHWSYYGECIASDTIIKTIEKLHNSIVPHISWQQIDVVDTARSRDADVLKSMNLYSNPQQNMKLAYPQILFEEGDYKNTTRVLTISDSYWYGPVYLGIPKYCFANGQFWYYYNKIVPRPSNDIKEVWQLDLKKEIESNQVIMLLYSDGNLVAFGNKFIQDVYELYTSPKTYYERHNREVQIQTFAQQIREAPLLLKKATQKSNDLQIPLDSAIRIEAMKMAGIN